jgi:hypothetical protein
LAGSGIAIYSLRGFSAGQFIIGLYEHLLLWLFHLWVCLQVHILFINGGNRLCRVNDVCANCQSIPATPMIMAFPEEHGNFFYF